MHLVVLAVPGCPHVNLLEQRLAQVLQGRRDVTVSRHVVDDQDEATRCGMHGSPTLLVDGTDPFAEPGQQASVSCRLYRDGSGRAEGAPSVSQLRQAISDPDAITAGTRADAGGPEHPDGQVLKSGARPSGGDHTEKGTSPDIRSRELLPQHKPETRRRVPGAQGCRGSGMPR